MVAINRNRTKDRTSEAEEVLGNVFEPQNIDTRYFFETFWKGQAVGRPCERPILNNLYNIHDIGKRYSHIIMGWDWWMGENKFRFNKYHLLFQVDLILMFSQERTQRWLRNDFAPILYKKRYKICLMNARNSRILRIQFFSRGFTKNFMTSATISPMPMLIIKFPHNGTRWRYSTEMFKKTYFDLCKRNGSASYVLNRRKTLKIGWQKLWRNRKMARQRDQPIGYPSKTKTTENILCKLGTV